MVGGLGVALAVGETGAASVGVRVGVTVTVGVGLDAAAVSVKMVWAARAIAVDIVFGSTVGGVAFGAQAVTIEMSARPIRDNCIGCGFMLPP